MKSRMHPKYYLCPDIFKREQDKIFKKMWFFAGLKSFLHNDNNYITRKIAGIPIVIQNFNGEIKAFENICLHRSAPLQTGFTGCRPLVCSYHAWKYDSFGKVSNIPHCKKLYDFDEQQQQSLQLKEFSVKIIGGLIFINLSKDAFPIEEQFSNEFISSLEDSSSHYDYEVITTTWHCAFNWKLAYENLRDFNHVGYVHPRTLAPFVDLNAEVDNSACIESNVPLSDISSSNLIKEVRRFSYGGNPEGALDHFRAHEWHQHVERWKYSIISGKDSKNDNSYFNWIAYPNLHIASGDGGYTFTIENHIPQSPGQTDIEIYYLTARKRKKYAGSSQVLLSAMNTGHSILKEDYDILEKIQDVIHIEAPIAEQGAYESTNRLIERWYTTLMEQKDATL